MPASFLSKYKHGIRISKVIKHVKKFATASFALVSETTAVSRDAPHMTSQSPLSADSTPKPT
jgi:hypothetical protein